MAGLTVRQHLFALFEHCIVLYCFFSIMYVTPSFTPAFVTLAAYQHPAYFIFQALCFISVFGIIFLFLFMFLP